MSDPATGLPKSIATVSLSGTLPEKLEAAAAIGFDGVEIFENDLLTFDGSPSEIRTLAHNLGLAITCFQPFRDFEAMPDPQRARNFDRAERKFDVMQALGTDLLLVCSNIQPSVLDDDARAAADLADLAERAQRRGLRIGYEALAWGRHVNRWRHAWSIVQSADHPALGLIVDSFHTLAAGDDPAGIADVPTDKLFFVQLADAPQLSMDVLSWSRHFRNFPGQGQLPVADFVRAVLAAGYRGPLSLEIFNDEFRAASARLMARDGLRSLLLVEAEAGLTRLPPPPTFDGIEFLEFAVDEETGRRLGEVLRTLGFHYAGRHRSKSVDLFRQGRANLVVNSEQDSAAYEHFQLHGPSVCAMALRVDNAARTLERAQALLCPTWQEPVGEGERHIPAVRAPDGSLVYLVEPDASGRSIYEDDFRLFPEQPPPATIAAIDHVAQALPVGRMDNFVLFYRAIFGFVPEQLWEIAGSLWPGAQPHDGQPQPQRPPAAEHLGKPGRRRRGVSSPPMPAPVCTTWPCAATTSPAPWNSCARAAPACCRFPPTTMRTSPRAGVSTTRALSRCGHRTCCTTATTLANICTPTRTRSTTGSFSRSCSGWTTTSTTVPPTPRCAWLRRHSGGRPRAYPGCSRSRCRAGRTIRRCLPRRSQVVTHVGTQVAGACSDALKRARRHRSSTSWPGPTRPSTPQRSGWDATENALSGVDRRVGPGPRSPRP